MKTRWWSNNSVEVQNASAQQDSQGLYGLLRKVFDPPSASVVPIKSKDGSTVIEDSDGIMGHWKEHFTDLFFNPSVIDEAAVDSIPQRVLIEELDAVPTREEKGKAPGLDGIPVELLQKGGEKVKSLVYILI